MERRNRYRNPVKMITVIRLLLVFLGLGLLGGGFVYVRNLHVKSGDRIRALELEIAQLDHESQLWELRVAGAKDRTELARRLKWMGSDLKPIDPRRVLKIKSSRKSGLDRDIVLVE